MRLRHLEVNGGKVQFEPYWRLILPPSGEEYADAQIDDYGLDNIRRNQYPWRPGTSLQLRARLSLPADELRGTAGFGFWNAPFGDPNIRWPALPQATWFFFASKPTDLPLAPEGAGRGWFAATIDASTSAALTILPLAPAVLLLNQFRSLQQRIWPVIRQKLQISFAPISASTDDWHHYTLRWMPRGCTFLIDHEPILETSFSPSGPLGFVAWVDNQYLIVTKRGRLGWGTLSTPREQMLEIAELSISGHTAHEG